MAGPHETKGSDPVSVASDAMAAWMQIFSGLARDWSESWQRLSPTANAADCN